MTPLCVALVCAMVHGCVQSDEQRAAVQVLLTVASAWARVQVFRQAASPSLVLTRPWAYAYRRWRVQLETIAQAAKRVYLRVFADDDEGDYILLWLTPLASYGVDDLVEDLTLATGAGEYETGSLFQPQGLLHFLTNAGELLLRHHAHASEALTLQLLRGLAPPNALVLVVGADDPIVPAGTYGRLETAARAAAPFATPYAFSPHEAWMLRRSMMCNNERYVVVVVVAGGGHGH